MDADETNPNTPGTDAWYAFERQKRADPGVPQRSGQITVEYVERCLEYLRWLWRIECDDERAHGFEDALRSDVLRAIADRHPQAALLAMAVLKSADIGFARWCA